jgi:hypothetical protein
MNNKSPPTPLSKRGNKIPLFERRIEGILIAA